ncbi:DpnII family type II restriction endonuclease, partial [Brachyspira pulli]|uniref:DpnII family type II restriction endonuclease n=1 Tax=Brachyspira pulli TaxID=310721 RepID=UPI003AAFE03C
MNRNFKIWLSSFRDSIADYKYYIDFEKVHCNVENIKVELNILKIFKFVNFFNILYNN